jgi:hypothetical protein
MACEGKEQDEMPDIANLLQIRSNPAGILFKVAIRIYKWHHNLYIRIILSPR